MRHEIELHNKLVGLPDSRGQLNTPVLCIDRAALERNIANMAAFARSHGVALRPHAKTHKSVEIAKLQIAAGAIGICCAKLGEAEVLASGGIENILITSPVVSAPAIARLASLNERIRGLAVVIDNPDNVRTLQQAIGSRLLDIYIDVDPGIRRTGVTSAQDALELYRCVEDASTLRYQGVQYYCGTQQHIASYAQRQTAIKDRTDYLRFVIEFLSNNGVPTSRITGSGTGTHRIDAELGVFTEWQVGSYVFMDQEYSACELQSDGGQAFEYSLFVEARVVSANTRGMATIDAGVKALATDGGSPVVISGAPLGSTYRFMGDEHGAIVDPEMKHTWEIGELVRLATPHCDPTVNLHDAYHVMNGDVLEAIWPVSARGRVS
jgi:D-serine deaminase-like pyridoxal phosphate-dependent protein